jgi:hypothetical protein
LQIIQFENARIMKFCLIHNYINIYSLHLGRSSLVFVITNIQTHTAISIKAVPEQSGKVANTSAKGLLGIAKKFINFMYLIYNFVYNINGTFIISPYSV